MDPQYKNALIVGAGHGLSASLTRLFTRRQLQVAIAARSLDKLADLAQETGAKTFACDAAKIDQVARLFDAVTAAMGEPDVVVYNASARARGPFLSLDPAAVEQTIAVSAYGGFLVAQHAARLMAPRGHGAILFTGFRRRVRQWPQFTGGTPGTNVPASGARR